MKTGKQKWNRLASYLAGEMESAQEQSFLGEVRQDTGLQKDLETMKETWKQFHTDPSGKYRNTEKAWTHLRSKMEEEMTAMDESIHPRELQKESLRLKVYRLAAMIALLLAVGIPTLYFVLSGDTESGERISHEAEEGILTVDLPDGSRVFLNKGSELDYAAPFNENRQVRLRGEGYFDVMSDPGNPFSVNAGKVVVTVLGTSFNVKEDAVTSGVEVYVESGAVHVELPEKADAVMLAPGELGKAGDHVVVTSQGDDNYLSWKTKKFKFVDESVEQILEVLERSYHVEVVSRNIDLSSMRLTTTYNEQSFDAILSTICTALDLEYEKEGKVYILQGLRDR